MYRFGWLAVALCALAVLTAGCRRGGEQYHDLVERDERFFLEDKVIELEDRIETLHRQLLSCRLENHALKREAAGGRSGGSIDVPGVVPPEIDRPSKRRASPPAADFPGELPGIDVTPGVEIKPGEKNPLLEIPPADGAGPVIIPSGDRLLPAWAEEPADTGQRIEKIVLNRMLTGGYNADRKPGDDGLLIVVEPRDAEGNVVRRSAEVDIAVLDPARRGEADARVATWHFDVAAAAAYLRKSALADGLHFELPWPGHPPTGTKLDLFVRYTTPDGRPLVAEREIEVEVAPPKNRGWRPPPKKPSPEQAKQSPPAQPPPTADNPLSKPTPTARRLETPHRQPRRPVWQPYR